MCAIGYMHTYTHKDCSIVLNLAHANLTIISESYILIIFILVFFFKYMHICATATEWDRERLADYIEVYIYIFTKEKN